MTYKQFMKEFEEYKNMRVAVALAEYKSARQAAEAVGIDPSTITRLKRGSFKNDHKAVSKLIGEDIEDIDITGDATKQFQIQLLERRIRELKGEI